MNTLAIDRPEHLAPPLVACSDVGLRDGVATGYVTPEATALLRHSLVEVAPYSDVLDGCGDGREVAPDSSDDIAKKFGPDIMPMHEGFASIFGGPVGKTVAFLVAGIAAASTKEDKLAFINNVGGIDGLMVTVREVRHNRSVIHSDESTEGSSLHFDRSPDKPNTEIGCLYNGSTDTVLAEIVSNPLVRKVALEDIARSFQDGGAETDRDARNALGAFKFLLQEIATHEITANDSLRFDRDDYIMHLEDEGPVAILEGEHPSVLDSELVLHFGLDRVGSPTRAHELGMDPYRNDLGRIALGIAPMFLEYKVEPHMFLKAAIILESAVRGVLTSVDHNEHLRGNVDPRYLPVAIIGNASLAAAEVREASGLNRDKDKIYIP